VKRIDSRALTSLNRILGLAGAGGSRTTDLEDSTVQQVLNVNDVLRRDMSLFGTDGLFVAILRNIHGAGVTTKAVLANPYSLTVGNIAPYPIPVDDGKDFWIFGIALQVASGTASNFTQGIVSIQMLGTQMAFGIDDLGAAVTMTDTQVALARFDDMDGNLGQGVTEGGEVFVPAIHRIRRDAKLRFDSSATNAITVNCQILCGLFPSGLGQDGSS